jgi:enamine deaminase RidA (YjgF/YER057c/UK114 family)
MNLAFQFGCPEVGLNHHPESVTIALPNAVIAGPGGERWVTGIGQGNECGGLALWRHDTELWGMGTVDVAAEGFQQAARRLYRDIFSACGVLSLYRIWNFIPRINAADAGMENYRAFCQGRHQAFDACFGKDSERRMPAASAVGTGGDRLCVVFIAGREPVRYVENPHQVPAYHYPSQYGPKAPSFARASVVEIGAQQRLYVSGTASIRRSESLHRGDVAAQFEVALDNVDVIARAAGMDDGLNGGSTGKRLFRLYLRHPQDWEVIREVFQRRLHRAGDRFNVVQADICRRELLVEIEACVVVGGRAGTAPDTI